MDERDTIRHFIGERLQRKGDAAGFSDSDSLLLSGRVDSLDVVGLVTFLEDAYGLDFSDGFDQNDFAVSQISGVEGFEPAASDVGKEAPGRLP